MPYNAYPTGADLQKFLAEAGITKDSSDLEGRAVAGRNLVEAKCARTFLAETAARVYTYAPPEGTDVLWLDDFAEITAVAYQPAGGTSTAWVADTDYVLERENGGRLRGGVTPPYTRLLLLGGTVRSPLSVHHRLALRVTGRQGYADELPEDVWEAMVQVGAGLALGVLSVSEGSGVVRWRRGDVEKQYAAGGRYAELGSSAVSLLAGVVAGYRRHSL